MDEFSVIRRYFAGLTAAQTGVILGIGDDCALLQLAAGEQLALTTDTLVAGRHFPLQTTPYDIGWKALAVNLSDLAAMAATPRWFTLALTLPEVDEGWLTAFAFGLKALADNYGVALVGGDTTRGPLSLTLTAMGTLPSADLATRRDGAKPGDVIAVTGTLGDGALALQRLDKASPADADEAWLRARLDRPSPRCEAALALRGLVHAAVDISDGLAADLGHILTASGCGGLIDAALLPRSSAFIKLADAATANAQQLHGGDDYELCLCISTQHFQQAQALCKVTGTALTAIGQISAETGLRILQGGQIKPLAATGFNHFAASA